MRYIIRRERIFQDTCFVRLQPKRHVHVRPRLRMRHAGARVASETETIDNSKHVEWRARSDDADVQLVMDSYIQAPIIYDSMS